MSDKKIDPVARTISSLESSVDQFTNALFNSEEFTRLFGNVLKVNSQFKESFSELMTKNLALCNIPSREDIESIGEQLMQIDERLMQIEELLRTQGESKPRSRARAKKVEGPLRTRKPVNTAMSEQK